MFEDVENNVIDVSDIGDDLFGEEENLSDGAENSSVEPLSEKPQKFTLSSGSETGVVANAPKLDDIEVATANVNAEQKSKELIQERLGLDATSLGVSEIGGDEFAQLDFYENQLTAYLVTNFEENRKNIVRMKDDFFRNENYVIYQAMKNVATERDFKFNATYLGLYMDVHESDLLTYGSHIELDTFEVDGYTVIDGLKRATLDVFKSYFAQGYLKSDSFNDTFVRFKQIYAGLALEDSLNTVSGILSKPQYINRKRYFGVDGAVDYLSRKLADIKSLTSLEKSFSMKSGRDIDLDAFDNSAPTLLAQLEYLPTLNKALSGLRTNTLITMVAPEKGMKSKMSARVSHSVLMNGHNVAFWGKEGGDRKVIAEMRAIHFDHYYNEVRNKKYPTVSATEIMMGTLSDEFKQLERISAEDFLQNPAYGVIYTPDYPFQFEHLDMVANEAKENGCDFMVIDYIGVMGSADSRMDIKTVIEKSYMRLESLKGALDMCFWCPMQMSKEAIQSMASGQHREMRNVTLNSNEPTRSSDANFMLYVNDDMDKKNVAKLYYLPSRIYGSFEDADVKTDKEANKLIELRGQKITWQDHEMIIEDKE